MSEDDVDDVVDDVDVDPSALHGTAVHDETFTTGTVSRDMRLTA